MKRRFRLLSLFMLLVLVGAFLPTTQAEAGARTITIDGSSFKNDGDWNNLRDQATVDGTKIIFPADSTEKTGFICKSVIRGDEFFDTLAAVECNLKFNKLPSDKSFVLAFGLPGIESGLGNKGNVEVTFTNSGGIKVGVVAYETAKTPITVCNPKSAGIGVGTNAKIRAEVKNSGKIIVSINDRTICTGTLPVTGEGRVGFLQTGSCAAEVSDFKLTAYQYYRPENSNINEDFSEGSLNISVLMGKTKSGNRTFTFEKYKDNPVLMFRSVGQTFLGTHADYSNFEMTFDVPYMTMKASTDENGEPLDGTGTFGVSFGSEKTNAAAKGYESAIDMVTFNQYGVYSYKNEEKYSALNPYWSEEKPFSIQVIVKDCKVTVGAKWMNDKNFQTLMSYDIHNRDVTGYVHFWVVDRANFAIGNLKITNLDHNPNLVEKEFLSGKIERPADWVYEQYERVYAPETKKEETEKTFSWYLLIPTTVLSGILVVVAVDRIVYICKKKKKEGVVHEK